MLLHQTYRRTFANNRDPGQARGSVGDLVGARYFAFLIGAAVLLALAVQILWLGGVTFKGALQVGLIGVLAPGLVWFLSHEELRLRKVVAKQGDQLEQRGREVGALNRMAQTHLADCFVDAPAYQGPSEGTAMLPQGEAVFVELRKILGLEPGDGSIRHEDRELATMANREQP